MIMVMIFVIMMIMVFIMMLLFVFLSNPPFLHIAVMYKALFFPIGPLLRFGW